MKYKTQFNQRKALRFRQFTRKGYALFACLGRVVTIGVLSVATLRAAAVTTPDTLSVVGATVVGDSVANSPDKEATLDDVEVTGSRAPLALGQAARMVTVLTREDIQAAPVQSINDLLKMAVGVDVRQRGPIGAQTDIGIRGSTQEQITILLNGINICDPQTGHNAFDLPCDVSDIVRIEVLEGPAARVYGTSSLVGAINIVSLPSSFSKEKGSKAQARIEGGSFGYLSAAGRLQFAPPFEGFGRGSLSASFTRSDGYQRSKAGALNSDYCGGKAFYQGAYESEQVHLNWHVGLSTKGFGSNTFYSAKYDEQYEKTTKVFTALQGEVSAGAWHFRPAIYWNRSYDRFELIRGDESKVPFNHHRTDVFGINLNSYFDWVAGRTAFGAEFRNEDIVSGNLGEPLNNPHRHYKYGLNRSNLSFHMEHNILLKRFTLSAGFVAVKNTWNEMSFTLYPGIDASFRLGEHWKVYASYNSSLRMPSFTELYYSVGGHKADKYLKPEEMRAVEGGVKYSSRWLTAQACIFHHHASNMIDWVLDTREADPVWQSVNHTKVNTLGQEVTINGLLAFGSWQLAYCHLHQQKQEADYLQSQYSLEYLRHKVTTQLTLRLGSILSPLTTNLSPLTLTLGYRWQDRMGQYTTIDGEVMDYHPYSVVDARLAWTKDTYSIYMEGNNLTGHRYVDYGNVPQPGCWITGGMKLFL
ncbi:MAG: TonB-dependent receptor [Prevotella sp.]|nr:TonB-dependent receptor [Prevotella sp.]